MYRFVSIVLLLGIGPLRAVEPRFEVDIRPILRAHCYDCHGAAAEVEGGLDLRLVRFAAKGGESGPAIVPGRPEESLLLARIRKGEMPPGEKKLSARELATIERWIAAGAPTVRPEPESIGPGLGITPEERGFWFFQPIRRPAVPEIETDGMGGIDSAIDALAFASDSASIEVEQADRRTLVMRAHLILTGLPPEANEVERWVRDSSPGWFERMTDALLASPAYGERWGRHWLDVAGYADSEGYTVGDPERPWAWRYRDWVVRRTNDDLPFDRFVTEQLAGDELAGPRDGDLTEEQVELLTATGFLRTAADGTGAGLDNPEARNQTIADTLRITSTALLGLSVHCARCHDHRYDPIPHTDYHALRAVFEPALDWRRWRQPNARRVSLYTAADRARAAEIEEETKAIAAERSARQAEYMKQALEKELAKFAEPLRERLRSAYETPGSKRTDEQRALLKSHPSVNISPGVLYQYIPESKPELKKYDDRIAEVRARKPEERFVRALVEPPGHVPETHLFHRGEHTQPRQVVGPAGLAVTSPEGRAPTFAVDDPNLPTTGRRLAFARWVTGPDNPLFARVIVNRVWMHHFGRGLVATPGDFGRLGARPSNPELLDWLASEFVRRGRSLKELHRVILRSAVWRQRHHPQAAFRRTLVRLDAEVIRDRMLRASGEFDSRMFGRPTPLEQDDTGTVVAVGTRRSLYIQQRRSRPVAFLESFDAPVMETNCESRTNSTVATQSLMLLNDAFVLERSAAMASRTAREAPKLDDERLVGLPSIRPARNDWSHGFGAYDDEADRIGRFTPLVHWTGSTWQAGPSLPDDTRGWVLLTASGGHPGDAEHAAIRRWTASVDGTVSISGSLSHPSENGDGVRGRVVSSRTGRAGEWIVAHSSVETRVEELPVKRGDTLDFVTDCRRSVTSDSFAWTVSLVVTPTNGAPRTVTSSSGFGGPAPRRDDVPGRIVRAWQLAYARDPGRDELELAVAFVADQTAWYDEHPDKLPMGRSAVDQAVTNLCQSLLGSNEFLYTE